MTDVELTVLGSDGTWPRAGGAASGYLVRHDGFALWVDAGTGTLANLQRTRSDRRRGRAGALAPHLDHFLDLYPFFYARWFGSRPTGRRRRCTRRRAAGSGARPAAARGEGTGAVRVRHPRGRAGGDVPPWAVHRAHRADAPLRADARDADRGGRGVDRVQRGHRADHVAGRSSRPGPTCWWPRRRWPSGTAPRRFHLSAAEAGEHAAGADAGRLVLSHLRAERERAAETARPPRSGGHRGGGGGNGGEPVTKQRVDGRGPAIFAR